MCHNWNYGYRQAVCFLHTKSSLISLADFTSLMAQVEVQVIPVGNDIKQRVNDLYREFGGQVWTSKVAGGGVSAGGVGGGFCRWSPDRFRRR
jgi:hypothetical protein